MTERPREEAEVWSDALLRKEQERDHYKARLAEAERKVVDAMALLAAQERKTNRALNDKTEIKARLAEAERLLAEVVRDFHITRTDIDAFLRPADVAPAVSSICPECGCVFGAHRDHCSKAVSASHCPALDCCVEVHGAGTCATCGRTGSTAPTVDENGPMVRYRASKHDDLWFRQYKKDPLPIWAVDVQDELPDFETDS